MKRKILVVVVVLVMVFAGLAVVGMEVIKGTEGKVEATTEPAVVPSETPTLAPTAEPTEAPVEEPTEAPTVEPTAAPTEAPKAEPIVVPTEEPTAEPTVALTAEPTQAPTMAPTEAPTAAPTAEPTEVPTPEPTEAPTPEPTEEPTPEPTAEPTPEPTEEPTPEPEEGEPEPTPEPHVHSYTTKTEEATCETAGRTYEECDCGDVRNEIAIAATGHDYKKWYVHVPTCKSHGYYKMFCSVCDAKGEEGTDPALPHEWDAGTIIHEGSCVEDRMIEYHCVVCGSPCGTEYIPQPDAHEYVETENTYWSEELLTVITEKVIQCRWCSKFLEE